MSTKTPARPPRPGDTIEVNGFAFREIRVRSGLAIGAVAVEIGISRPYLARIEMGARIRVSPPVFAGMLRALQITDRRAILADPKTEPAETAS